MKSQILVAMLSAILLVVGGPARAHDQITIGVVTDLSGAGSYYGQQTRVGAMLAEQELRASGKHVRIILEDSALNTQQGISAAQKLLYVDKVDALYVDFTVISVAVSSLAQVSKKLMFYSAAARSVAASNPFSFKTYADYHQGCEAIAREFKKRGVARIGVLKAETEYGELCLEGVRKVYQEVSTQSYRAGEMVPSQMLYFKSRGIEAVINGAYEGDVMNMLKSASSIGYLVKVGTAEDTFTTKLRDTFRDRLEGSISFGLQQLSGEVLGRAMKIEGAERLSGYEGVGLSYLHIKQISSALEQCHGQTVECVVSKLSESGADDAVGFAGFRERIAQLKMTVKEFQKGEFRQVGSYLSGIALK